jgi:signal transduction histidine kinase
VVVIVIYELLSHTSVGAVSARAVSSNGAFVTTAPPGVVAHQADVSQLFTDSWIVLALTTLASIPLGWIIAGRVLRPIRTITDSARTISAGNLHERLALEGPEDEFKRLGDTLDDLLARLEAAFAAQRRFVANASHELRTPLTLERTLLQVALADPDADAARLRAACEEVLATGAEQERLLEALLTLASSERGLERREPVALDELVARSVERVRRDAEWLKLTVTTELLPAHVLGDEALLERLAANLLDNAVEYNVAHGHVEVRTETTAEGRAELSVANGGPLIPSADAERLLEPFQRLGPGRARSEDGHHGLGLSIVGAIAAAHGATLEVRARPGGGLTVTVSFP